MRTILIVGDCQAGLQLALGLQRRGNDVTVVSDRPPEDIAAGTVMSSQCMFGTRNPAGLAPAPGQQEMDLSEHTGTAAGPG